MSAGHSEGLYDKEDVSSPPSLPPETASRNGSEEVRPPPPLAPDAASQHSDEDAPPPQASAESDAVDQPDSDVPAPEPTAENEAASSGPAEGPAPADEPASQDPDRALAPEFIPDSLLVPDILEQIQGQIDRVTNALPGLFVSSQQQFDLSRGLRTVRTLLVRSASERVAIPDLRHDFKDGWNQFVESLEAVVQLDDTPNVVAFCEDKLAFVRRPIDDVRTKLAAGNPRAQTRQAFEALDAAFATCSAAVSGLSFQNSGPFQAALSRLSIRLQSSEPLFRLTAPDAQAAALTKALTQFVGLCQAYVGNALQAKQQRLAVAAVAHQAKGEITALFSDAMRRRRLPKDTDREPPQQAPTTRVKTVDEIKRLPKMELPVHSPTVKRRLFEEPKRVAALRPKTKKGRGLAARAATGDPSSRQNQGAA